jgi:hypothetical protein
MSPLDQDSRDWTKGNCFYVTLEFMKDSEELRASGKIPTDASVALVHGLLSANDKRIRHAWIEIDNIVLDHSNNQAILLNSDDYYRNNDAAPCRKFSRSEADALLTYLQNESSSLPIVYWGDLSEQDVACAVDCYQESSGVFSSGVCFSDPSDPVNADNIQLPRQAKLSANNAET